MAANFKDTLNLPKTAFPMRAGLVQREPQRLDHWGEIGLYERLMEKRATAELWVLHDGPPFTNGDIHMGHILNKSLKDFCLRYKSLRGYRTPYVPGWDCHGLPIEHKVAVEAEAAGKTLSPVEMREACDAYSEKYIGVQTGQFRRLGILGDWENPYKTKDPAYEADILRTFGKFVENGLVYRSKKPVYWSIPCQTALAEAEIEYRDHVSPSIWVKFALEDEAVKKLGLSGPANVVIWTTTPWTLPANLAVAVHPKLDYVALAREGEQYLVAQALAEAFLGKMGWEGTSVSKTFSGEELAGLNARHPFIDRTSPLVLAEYVTTDAGTGCVHTAPGHGMDDYLTGLKYGLEIYCPVQDDGTYEDDGRVPQELVGLSVLPDKKGRAPANKGVLGILEGNGSLLKLERYEHSYPHCWRSKTPVVFRAMAQWFVELDKDGLRENALAGIDRVQWEPAWGMNRIRGAVENRPDWCISRQRAWGVPLPAFYDEAGNDYLDAGVIAAIAEKVEKAGTNLWFSASPAELLAGVELPGSWPAPEKLSKGGDTLDVWIDSGTSHQAVLKKRGELKWPADLYLEGSDQHRGWFQSSLWTGMVTEGKPPYATVLTHGFLVSEEGRKLSKSEGAKTALEWIDAFGVDILRLWIAASEYRSDVPVSEEIVSNVSRTYRDLRNTLRFLLSNLYDFDAATDTVPVEERTLLDRWALGETAHFLTEVTAAYEQFAFHKVYQLVSRFSTVTLSATYHDILKDRLYTLAPAHPRRRAAQSTLREIFEVLCKVLSPVMLFTADEAWSHYKAGEDFHEGSVHLEDWPVMKELGRGSGDVMSDFLTLSLVRNDVLLAVQELRDSKKIGQSLEAAVTLKLPQDPTDPNEQITVKALHKYEAELAELFIVSAVSLEEGTGETVDVSARPAEGERCPRCWRTVPALEETSHGTICPRCAEALATIQPC